MIEHNRSDQEQRCLGSQAVLTPFLSSFLRNQPEPVQDVSPPDEVLAPCLDSLNELKDLAFHLATRAEELKAFQEHQLSGLLANAVQTCPFYRQRLGADWQPTENAWESLRQFTPLEKRDVQKSLMEIWSEDAVIDELHFWMTSGSTGEPTQFIVDEFNANFRDVSFCFIQHLIGNDDIPAQPEQTLMLRISSAEGVGMWYKKMPFFNNALLWKMPVFRNPKCNIDQVLQFVRHEQPPMLAGDPQAFLTFIETWQQRFPEESVYSYPLVSLTCGGNQLSPEVRSQIEAFFNKPLTDCYGLSETSLLASQCTHGTFHLHSPFNYVEILDEAGNILPDGEMGEIVVTNMMNWTFPFIRYRTGDLGRLDHSTQCPCGLTLPILYDFQGRKRRFLVKPDGQLLAPQTLVPIFVDLPLYQYQLIQETPVSYRFRYIPKMPLTDAHREWVISQLSVSVGTPLDVAFESNEDSLVEPGVKFQDFISLCHNSVV